MIRKASVPALLAAVALGLLAGCAGAPTRTPWLPEGQPQKMVMLVMPMQMDRSKLASVATPAELTELFVKKLETQEVPAVQFDGSMNATGHLLACDVPDLNYVVGKGYPRRLNYRAQLHCQIKDSATHEVFWERTLDQEYEERVLFNTMTKRPEHHEWQLYRECIVPLWESMAYGVRLFMYRPQLAHPTVRVEPVQELPPPSPYTK